MSDHSSSNRSSAAKALEVKVHKATSISFCTAPGQSSDLAMLMTVPLETCPGVEMSKRYMTLPLLCYSCPVHVFLCFIEQSLDKVTAEEQLMGQCPPCRSYRNRAEKAARNKEKFNPPFHNLIQDKKTSLSVLERQGNQILPVKSGFCDGIQVWLFHFHFTFQRKQKLGQTTARGFISLVTSVKVSQHCLRFTGIITPDRIL